MNGKVISGNPCVLQLGDVINFGSGPAIVTMIMPILFTYLIYTTRGNVELNFLTDILIFRPNIVEMSQSVQFIEVLN